MGRFLHLPSPADAEDEDPLSGVANIFDVSVVFIVGLMITLFSVYRIGDLVDPDSEVTLVKTNADGLSEIIVKRGTEITAYELTGETLGGRASASAPPIGWRTGRSSTCPTERCGMRAAVQPAAACRVPQGPEPNRLRGGRYRDAHVRRRSGERPGDPRRVPRRRLRPARPPERVESGAPGASGPARPRLGRVRDRIVARLGR